MRPSPNELVAGVRTLLREVVSPAANTPEATAALRKIAALLRDQDWNEAPLSLMRENEIWTAQLRALGVDLADASPSNSYAEALAINRERRKAVAEFIDAASAPHSPSLNGEQRQLWRKRIARTALSAMAGYEPRREAKPGQGSSRE